MAGSSSVAVAVAGSLGLTVMVWGKTGVGKSAVIKCADPLAPVTSSDGLLPGTLKVKVCPFVPMGARQVSLIDTVGLFSLRGRHELYCDEAFGYLCAELYGHEIGVNLILVVFNTQEKMCAELSDSFRLLSRLVGGKHIPICFVFTHEDVGPQHPSREAGWWVHTNLAMFKSELFREKVWPEELGDLDRVEGLSGNFAEDPGRYTQVRVRDAIFRLSGPRVVFVPQDPCRFLQYALNVFEVFRDILKRANATKMDIVTTFVEAVTTSNWRNWERAIYRYTSLGVSLWKICMLLAGVSSPAAVAYWRNTRLVPEDMLRLLAGPSYYGPPSALPVPPSSGAADVRPGV